MLALYVLVLAAIHFLDRICVDYVVQPLFMKPIWWYGNGGIYAYTPGMELLQDAVSKLYCLVYVYCVLIASFRIIRQASDPILRCTPVADSIPFSSALTVLAELLILSLITSVQQLVSMLLSFGRFSLQEDPVAVLRFCLPLAFAAALIVRLVIRLKRDPFTGLRYRL
jgi:hypothetical protein